jgi:cell division septum initiation protein DivIVA
MPQSGELGLDDSSPTPVTSDQAADTVALDFDSDEGVTGSASDSAGDLSGTTGSDAAIGTAVSGGTTGTGTGAASSAGARAGEVAGSAAEKAGDVAGSAAEKAGELKDAALERSGDVAAVAKDELARLAHEARSEFQSLWSNASEQLRGQAATGQQQISELLHSLSGELGEMASKSDNPGPLTSLAKQAAARGGEWSHWLANSEPADVLTELRRFARRRPFVFLAGAALAGVVVGRVGRGLMAAADTDQSPTRTVSGATASVPATAGVTTPPVVTYEEVPSFGTGEAPEQVGSYASQASSANPYGLNGGSDR